MSEQVAGGGGFGFGGFGYNQNAPLKKFTEYQQYLQGITSSLYNSAHSTTAEELLEQEITRAVEKKFESKSSCHFFEQFLDGFEMLNEDRFPCASILNPMCFRARLAQLTNPKAKVVEIVSLDFLKGSNFELLCDALEKAPNIKTLTITGTGSLKSILQLLSGCKHIETLNFLGGVNKVEDYEPQDYAMPNLKHANFGVNVSSFDQTAKKRVLFPILKYCPKIETVILENEVTPDLCEFVQNATLLTYISLNGKHTYFYGTVFVKFCEALAKNKSIKHFSMGESGNERKTLTPTESYEKINLLKSEKALKGLLNALSHIPSFKEITIRSTFVNHVETWNILAESLSKIKIDCLTIGDSQRGENTHCATKMKIPTTKIRIPCLCIESCLCDMLPKILDFIKPDEIILSGNTWSAERVKSIPISKLTLKKCADLTPTILGVNLNDSIKQLCIMDCNISTSQMVCMTGLLQKSIPIEIKFTPQPFSCSIKSTQNTFENPTKMDSFPTVFLQYEDKRVAAGTRQVGLFGGFSMDPIHNIDRVWSAPLWFGKDSSSKFVEKLSKGEKLSQNEIFQYTKVQ